MFKYELCGLLKLLTTLFCGLLSISWCKQQWKLPKLLWTCRTKSNVSIKVAAAFSKTAFVETLDLMASHQSVLSSALQKSSDKFNTGLKPVKSELVYWRFVSFSALMTSKHFSNRKSCISIKIHIWHPGKIITSHLTIFWCFGSVSGGYFLNLDLNKRVWGRF